MESDVAKSILEQRIEGLQCISKPKLMAMWLEMFGTAAPNIDIRLLRQHLAVRLQSVTLGGLDDTLQEELADLKKRLRRQGNILTTKKKQHAMIDLPIGTHLTRDYRGERHEVLVLAEGLEYRGQLYKSLTKIASVITKGGHWSGPVFFGLRKTQ